jgi:hypothetical protein
VVRGVALSDPADDRRRVLVTGMGAFGAGGVNVADLWRNAVAGWDGSRGRQLASGLTLPVHGAPNPPRLDTCCPSLSN